MSRYKKIRMPKGYKKGVITRKTKNYSANTDYDEYDYWVQGVGSTEA